MSNDFEFNAPQYASPFENLINDEAGDQFFDVLSSPLQKEKIHTPSSEKKKKTKSTLQVQFETPAAVFHTPRTSNKQSPTPNKHQLQRSPTPKTHSMLTRSDLKSLTPEISLELRSRSVLRSPFKEMKRKASPTKNNYANIKHTKFISVAEMMYHFHRDTPPRFRSQNTKNPSEIIKTEVQKPIPITVPKTPVLLCTARSRPLPPSHEDLELQEIDNFNKMKTLPLPLNKKILEHGYEVSHSKQFTVPEPFNLTNIEKKKVEISDVKPFIFKAQPIPAVLNSTFTSHRTNRESRFGSSGTMVQPFSFEKRIREAEKRRKDKLLQVYEKERRLREFKARPVPVFIKKQSMYSSHNSIASSHSHCCDSDRTVPFKANSPLVLRKKPFEVKKPNRILQPLDVQLNTQRRAKDRAAYDEMRIKNQELMEIRKQQSEEAQRAAEAEDIILLRKSVVHQARPLPKFYRRRSNSTS